MKIASKKERKLLEAMVAELNERHRKFVKEYPEEANAEDGCLYRTQGDDPDPRFELEFVKEDELEDYESQVGLHDMLNEEGEFHDVADIAILMMDIRYFSGYHRTSAGI